MRSIKTALLLAVAAGGIWTVEGQVSPNRSLQGLRAAEGLEVTLFASEPDRKPRPGRGTRLARDPP